MLNSLRPTPRPGRASARVLNRASGGGGRPISEPWTIAARCAWLILLAVVMSSCALFREESPEPPPVVEPEPEPMPEAPRPSGDAGDALRLIEVGRYDDARELLEWLMEQGQGNATVRLLLRQIVVPPEQQLPGPYRELELPAGDSLSQVAERELGNPMLFVVLARLNDIDVPRNVPAGTVLRLPEPSPQPEPEPESESDPESESEPQPVQDESGDAATSAAEPETTASDLLTVSDYLHASGQPDQALALLRHALLESDPPPGLQEHVAERSVERADELAGQGEFDQASAVLREGLDVVTRPGPKSSLEQELANLEARDLMRQAREQRDAGDLKMAHDLARRAYSRSSSLEATNTLYGEIREQYRRETHERALTAYRERDVDLAIRSWQELLTRIPEFDAARIYLKRAEELRSRLDQ